jgi:hypothetical protein
MPPSFRPTRKAAAVLGFLAKIEVDAIFKQQPFEMAKSGTDPITSWRMSSEAVRQLPPTPRELEIGILDERSVQVIGEIKSRPTFARYYETVDDYQFALVPINGLLTPQWLADMDYIHEVGSQVTSTSSLEDLLRFTMAEGRITEPIVNGAQVIFQSSRPDLHADQVPSVREVAPGEFEIVTRVVSRPNYVQVASIGDRLLLTNGVHRVCALYLHGHASVPCLLRKVARVEETGVNLQTTLFRPDLIGGTRPAQVIDFFHEEVAIPLKMRSTHHVLRVAIGTEMMRVPAVSGPDAVPVRDEEVRHQSLGVPGRLNLDRPSATN